MRFALLPSHLPIRQPKTSANISTITIIPSRRPRPNRVVARLYKGPGRVWSMVREFLMHRAPFWKTRRLFKAKLSCVAGHFCLIYHGMSP
ncbi:hypothetical protein K469DRAFT_142724 [Zopfia rhizophila CBS 207.26]|uniref:Uncharacterized protein n=1 Tax=Zopfia rhizophila CBS 207.26 TaxID=1314779 RepID=A0A6A6E7B2_9PEZI|nr:hypothetical protein K469DRAFT_142724 [Zopfia rhizophila CBS 207.26]